MLPRDRALLLVAVGFLLVLNPLYAFPNGGHEEVNVTYTAEAVDRVPSEVVYDTGLLRTCQGPSESRECALAQYVGYDGHREIEGVEASLPDDDTGLYTDTWFVRFDSGWARPNATVENGTLVLSYEPVPWETVADREAWPLDESDPVAREAVREGSASTGWYDRDLNPHRGPGLDEDERFVRDGGAYYYLQRTDVEYRDWLPRWQVRLVHVGGVLLGIALAFHGRGRHARLVDEARENDELEPRYPL